MLSSVLLEVEITSKSGRMNVILLRHVSS